MPKHVALGIAVRHTKRSKQRFLWFSVRIPHGGIITMFSRMGQCSSYDDVEAMDTSITNATIANSDIFGVVLPSHISTGVFVQVAGDKNEDTLLGGMRTTQATTLILFQRGQFGPASKTAGLGRPNKVETLN